MTIGELIKNKVVLAATIVASATSLAIAGWTTADYLQIRPIIKREFIPAMDQLEKVQQSVMLMQFQYLIEKQKHQPLTMEEQMQLCAISRVLGITVQGCY